MFLKKIDIIGTPGAKDLFYWSQIYFSDKESH